MKKIFTITSLFALFVFFKAATAQTLLSQGKTVTVSSTESASYPGSNAVDGNFSTVWSSASTNYNQWLYVDLGGNYDISSVYLYWSGGRYATTFDIMTSTDGTNWTAVYTINGNTGATTNGVVGLHSVARYVKFNGRGRANTSGYRIAEFKVLGYNITTTAQQNDLNLLQSRFLANYTAGAIGDLRSRMNAMQPDGHWTNLTYTYGGTWPTHSLYLNEMAQAWAEPANVSYHDTTMLSKIVLGFGYLVRTHPGTGAWWDTTVRVPNNLLVALVIMKNHVNADSLYKFSNYILDLTDNASSQGMNRAWVSEDLIRKGVVENRFPLTDKGYSNEASTLAVVSASGAEGVMIDSTFHQHGNQLYSGGYGRDFITDLATYLRTSSGTSFNSYFTTTYKANLSGLYLGGAQMLSYRASFDFGAMGRYISRTADQYSVAANFLDTMKLNDPVNTTAYQNWENYLAGGNFPTAYQRAAYYWKSPVLVSHGPNYYLSARIISSRSRGAEEIDNENLKGYNVPLGATNVMVTGNEYTNIFPTWKWSRVPGTTAEKSEAQAALSGYFDGTNTFGGGLSYNEIGIIAYQHNYHNVTANKAYVMMENMMLCLGNNIRSAQPNEIITNVEQSLTNGTISYSDGTTHTFTADSTIQNTIQWVNHNNIGYLFPSGGQLTMMNQMQSGSWHAINTTQSSTTVNNQVFSLWVDHGVAPTGRSYLYIIAPNKALADMPAAYSGHGFVVPVNTTSIQAVRNDQHHQYAVVFYAAGSADMGDGLTISTDKPALVFIRQYTTNYRISVADPNYSQSTINITLNKNVTGSGVTHSGSNSTIPVTLPSGDRTGATFTGFYTIATDPGMAALAATQAMSQDSNAWAAAGVGIYPNPASSVIYVTGLTAPADIDVYNLAGHKFKTVHATSVDVSGLQAGVTYFLRIHVAGTVVSKQFVKN